MLCARGCGRAIENAATRIDCHKGIARRLPAEQAESEETEENQAVFRSFLRNVLSVAFLQYLKTRQRFTNQ